MGHFKLNNYLLQEDAGAVFCSPFRRRRQLAKAVSPGEVYLSREEAWALYLAKLEEEANYFSVGDSVEPDSDICTCHTCIVSIMTLIIRIFSLEHKSAIYKCENDVLQAGHLHQ